MTVPMGQSQLLITIIIWSLNQDFQISQILEVEVGLAGLGGRNDDTPFFFFFGGGGGGGGEEGEVVVCQPILYNFVVVDVSVKLVVSSTLLCMTLAFRDARIVSSSVSRTPTAL